MAAEEIRPPPAPSLYSRPARQSGGLLGGDVALGPARPLPGGAGSERREERGELPGSPRPPVGKAAGGQRSGSGGEQWRRHVGEPGRDLHRGAPGEERGRAGPKGRGSRAAVLQGHSPSCLRSLLRRASRSRLSSPSAELLRRRRLLRQKGGVHPAPLAEAEAAARPPARPPSRRTRGLSSRRLDPAERKAAARRSPPSWRGRRRLRGLSCRISAALVRASSRAGRGGGRGLPG